MGFITKVPEEHSTSVISYSKHPHRQTSL